MNLGERYALPILWYLFRRIERSLHGQPAAILLDEAWLMLGHAVFREKIREWLKVMRKANCAVILATQSLSDAARSGILDVLDESCPTKVFLPNASARADDAAALYRRFGLNEREIEIIAGAIPKREYYFTSEKGRRLINLELGPMALAFLGVSDKDSVAEVQRCEAEYGDGWVDEWLVRKGLAPMGNGIEVKKSQERLVLV
jgi:type IV secretion system protein TrbE